MRYETPSLILRYGTIAGLIMAALGEVLVSMISPAFKSLTYCGLGMIVTTPMASLVMIAAVHAIRHDLKVFTLAILALVIMITATIAMLARG